MKTKNLQFYIIALLAISATTVFGQNGADSVLINDGWGKKITTMTPKKELKVYESKSTTSKVKYAGNTYVSEPKSVELTIFGENIYKKERKNRKKSKFYGNWSGIYFGLTTYLEGGDVYTSNDGFMHLDWSASQTVLINPFQVSVALSRRNNVGMVFGVGIEYQNLRFEDDHTSIVNVADVGVIEYIINEDFSVRRSTLKNLYLTIPILFEVQIGEMHASVGAIGAIRLHSKTKVVYDYEGDKEKMKNTSDFGMIPFKLDVTARVGYKSVSIFSNYTLTTMFEANGPNLHPLTIGFGISW